MSSLSPVIEHLVAHGVKLLTNRPHTTREITQKLLRVCARRQTSKLAHIREDFQSVQCPAAVAEAVGELQGMHVLDDVAYSTWHASQRAAHRPRSVMQLRAEMFSRGVSSNDMGAAVRAYDEVAAASSVAERKPRADAEALSRILRNKGFPTHVIRGAVEHRKLETEEAADDEMGPSAAAASWRPPTH